MMAGGALGVRWCARGEAWEREGVVVVGQKLYCSCQVRFSLARTLIFIFWSRTAASRGNELLRFKKSLIASILGEVSCRIICHN